MIVTPAPVQPGGPPLWMASTSPASVARAIRFDTHLLPQGPAGVVLDGWRDRVRAEGHDPDSYRVGIIRSCLVSGDRDRDWPAPRDAERYRMAVYGRFAHEAGRGSAARFSEPDRIPQWVIVGDVGQCVAELVAFITRFGLTDVLTWGSAPGLPPEALTPSLVRFTTEVVPAVRDALGQGGG